MHWLWVFVIGLIVGLVAKLLMPGKDPGGFIITAIIGIAGSLLATWVGQNFGWYQEGQTAGFIASVIGAIVLLLLCHLVMRKTSCPCARRGLPPPGLHSTQQLAGQALERAQVETAARSRRSHLAARCQVINGARQHLRKLAEQLALIDPQLACRLLQKRTQAALLQGLAQLVARDRLVRPGAHPRLHRVAKSVLLQHGDEALHAAGALDQLSGHRNKRTGSGLLSLATQQIIEQ
jgi:uncharacterized membrane protein YeaQ/YmgE (transglycosylase-associated protein family)